MKRRPYVNCMPAGRNVNAAKHAAPIANCEHNERVGATDQLHALQDAVLVRQESASH
jgi:hypothetical protein